MTFFPSVIPVKTGIPFVFFTITKPNGMPTHAGMTDRCYGYQASLH